MLTCSCNDEWDEDGWAFFYPEDLEPFDGARRKRCSSCKALIDKGSDALKFRRIRYPRSEVEIRIYGEDRELPIAPF
ncbi:MAG: hypothetical protein AB7E47_03220 [Desulfovibrionaceae bacterium]